MECNAWKTERLKAHPTANVSVAEELKRPELLTSIGLSRLTGRLRKNCMAERVRRRHI